MIVWYTTFVLCESEDRNIEFVQCLKLNLKNKHIDKIVLFTDDKFQYKDEKLNIIRVSGRPTFNDFFALMGKKEINCIANADIFVKNSIKYSKILTSKNAFFISRYDLDTNANRVTPFRFEYGDSHDLWIFNGKPILNCQFSLGILGCDNLVLHNFRNNGWSVFNFSFLIHAFHLHESNFRNQNQDDRVSTIDTYGMLRPSIKKILSLKLLSQVFFYLFTIKFKLRLPYCFFR